MARINMILQVRDAAMHPLKSSSWAGYLRFFVLACGVCPRTVPGASKGGCSLAGSGLNAAKISTLIFAQQVTVHNPAMLLTQFGAAGADGVGDFI